MLTNLKWTKANNNDDKAIDATGEYFIKRSPKICFLQNISSKMGTINTRQIKFIATYESKYGL
jgi:hypothetical protein